MKLTRDERRRLILARDGEADWPKITRPPKGGKPCEPGEQLTVSSIFWLEVTDLRRDRHGDYVVVYEARVMEKPRYLAPAGKAVPIDDHGDPKPMSHDEAHGYTGNPKKAVDRDAPAVSSADQELITARAERDAEKQLEQERLRREQLTLETRLGIARKVAEVKGIDISRHELAIKRKIRDIEQLLDKQGRQAA